MVTGPRSRRSLLRGGGALLAAALGGCLGRRADRLRANAGPRGTEAGYERGGDRWSPHGIGAVCHNAGDRRRSVALTVAPADGGPTDQRSVSLDAGETVSIPELIEEPVNGSVPHEVVARTAGGASDAATVVANAVHDVHGIHVVVDGDGLGVRVVEH